MVRTTMRGAGAGVAATVPMSLVMLAAGRRRTMVAAHLVYGAVLGAAESRLANGSGGTAAG